MKRVSCVLLPMLPLQILLRKKPHWNGAPVAVVDDEGPHGRLTHLNTLARKGRLHIGMRQTVARDLLPNLHTAVVSSEEALEISRELITSLQTFSPRVEALDHAGAFHIDPEGLRRIYGGYRNWAMSIHRYLRARHWRNSVSVGFHRHRALAVAMTHLGITILRNVDEERERSNKTPLRAFDLPGELYESLEALGIETLSDFLVMPAGDGQARFTIYLPKTCNSQFSHMPLTSQHASHFRLTRPMMINTACSSRSRAPCTRCCIRFGRAAKPFNPSIFRFIWSARLFIKSTSSLLHQHWI
jgi:nucleotidyltransferase/DNA polymerase involved in DNA repair